MAKQKAIIFDIDDTLIASKNRKILALNRIAQYPIINYIPNIECLQKITPSEAPNEYAIDETMKQCKIREQDKPVIKNHWINLFLHNTSFYNEKREIVADKIKGSDKAVQSAKKKGYSIIFLTGRHDEPNDSMKQGTIDELTQNGFILDNGTQLIMKPKKTMNDAEFKSKALQEISNNYEIDMIFDDMPNNISILKAKFPNALQFGVLTNNKCDDFIKDTICISDFTDKKLKQYLQ